MHLRIGIFTAAFCSWLLGIQAADIIAWAVNRENTVRKGKTASYMADIIRTVIPSLFVVWDEAKMRQQFKPLIYKPWLRRESFLPGGCCRCAGTVRYEKSSA